MEVDEQDREQVDSERKRIGAKERVKEDKLRKKQTLKHVMTCA